ncbi:MAG: hypothetical protein K0U98_11550 [Deltaproteobacteria bacterium]|nr:hypothetical protein [Deltaproteobacteria bacterium]
MLNIQTLAEALDNGEDQLEVWADLVSQIPGAQDLYNELLWSKEVTGVRSFSSALGEMEIARSHRDAVLEGEFRPATVRVGVAALLVREAGLLRARDPHKALELSEAATRITGTLPDARVVLSGRWPAAADGATLLPERYHSSVEWVSAKALALAGNSYRVIGDLRAAVSCFQRIRETERSRDLPEGVQGELASLEASLLIDAGERSKAEVLLGKSEKMFELSGDPKALAKTRIKLAHVRYEGGSPGQALEILEGFFDAIPADSHLGQIALLNCALYSLDAGDIGQAKRLVTSVSRFSEPAFELRRQWLEARLCDSGSDIASSRFEAVTLGFQLAGLPLSSALAAMDWTLLLLKQGRIHEARVVSEAVYSLLSASGLPAAALAALHFFLDAYKSDRLDEAIVRSVSIRLFRSR